jgi:hypothetical protein
MDNKIEKNTIFFLNENAIMEYFEDGAVLYTDESEIFFAVNKFGAEILKHIETNKRITIESMVSLFCEKYYVSKMELERDLTHFMLKLTDIGAIMIEEKTDMF